MAATAASKRHITQETFNECVRENMEEFDMSEEDAIADAVTQFESQGVDLSTVVKGLDVVHPVLTALHAIEADESDDEISLQGHLKTLQEQFNDALVSDGAKELAGRSNGPVILVQRLPAVLEVDTRIMLFTTIQCMVAGNRVNQSLVGDAGIATTFDLGVLSSHVETQTAALLCLKSTCARHEVNKKRLASHGIVARLLVLFRERSTISDGSTAASSTKDIADVIRVLTVHDDVESMFSQTHDIIKQFVEHAIIDAVMPFLQDKSRDPDTLSSWLAVVKQLAITEDTCRKLVTAGILDLLPTFQQHAQHRALLSRCLGLLRNLAAVDEYKTVVTTSCLPWILSIMQQHPKEAYLQTLGCATIAAICLRSPPNCERAAGLQAHCVVGIAMHSFPSNVALLRQASLAIRNMVVRNEALRPIILEDPHVESQLRLAMPIRGCGDEAYAALRDLGADVPLASIGQAQSANFNPVMESSNQLVGRIQENATAPFGEFD
ncbi:hypothetical protein H310_13519 [Aphanomyces invadans]|uniref:Uncharacterized protein n=1 Tax=Aphanomyces invadans TaxID=157072 RepID=A0A024TFI9_9STRA|nr:hypothetical protein H310_13519 [Aphanomyces invadans]ETV92122.1 hypothetical protein H310_13519 [Aphanomyces invadans]|eukprot:XP_008879284.1 hypothetical protein H310_13519 [Aphanomyces invadans]